MEHPTVSSWLSHDSCPDHRQYILNKLVICCKNYKTNQLNELAIQKKEKIYKLIQKVLTKKKEEKIKSVVKKPIKGKENAKLKILQHK